MGKAGNATGYELNSELSTRLNSLFNGQISINSLLVKLGLRDTLCEDTN